MREVAYRTKQSMSEKLNILVIEDNTNDAKLASIYLKEASIKHVFHHATTFAKGVEQAAQTVMDIVLLDLNLPDSRALETLNSFKSNFPKLPIILLTGENDDALIERAGRMGAQDYIVKGNFDSKLLSKTIKYAIQRHKKQVHLEETEHQLKIAQARAQAAEELAAFGIWEIDVVTNKMTWSDQIYKIFGFSPGVLSPTQGDYLSYVHLEDRERVRKSFEEAGKDGQTYKIEYRIIIDGTKIKHLANQFQVTYDELTGKTLLVGAVQNITEQKQAELLIAEKRISEKTSKIKEELLEDLSFQIRTPLSSVFSFSYLLDTLELSTSQRENLSALQNSVDDLSIAINNMLNFSLLLSEKIKVEEKTVQFGALLSNLKRLFKVKSDNKHIDLQINLPKKELPMVIGDENKINQILFNAVDNAIKYSEDEGKVTISVKASSPNEEEAEFEVIIEDEGKGMEQKLVTELLESDALIQMEEDNQKRGLGIPIMKRLIETMDGNLTITSEEEEGTQVKIQLKFRKAAVTKKPKGGKPISPVKILFVEDHFLNQISTSSLMKRWSDQISVEIAENGQIGVDMYNQNNDYQLVLMDLQMPVMGGIEAAKKIRETSQVPIIALSANTSTQEAEKCKEAGMNDYLAKPFQPEELFSKIMTALYGEDD